MFKNLTKKLRIKKSDKALISKLDKIKETKGNTPTKPPTIDGTIDNDSEESPGEQQELTIQEQLQKIEEKISTQVEKTLQEKTKNLVETVDTIKELDARITKMDVGIASAKQAVDTFQDRLDKVDENILELLSLYEVVSNTVNPFVGDNEGGGVNLERLDSMDKQLNELSQTINIFKNEIESLQTALETPQTTLPEGFEDQINERFTTLESSIQAFQELVEMQTQNTPDMDSIIENITQQVTQQITEQLNIQLTEQITTQITEQIEPLKETIKTELSKTTKEETTQENTNTEYCRDETANQTDNIGKYRLPRLDNRPQTSIILLNWIEFLMEKVGRNNLIDVLDYYTEIGWISEEVSTKMITYADGIDYYVEKPTWKLLPEDHTKSLMFIEQLRGNKIDKSSFNRLEREIDRVKHSMETLYGI